jgi:phage shock protein C
MTHSPQRKRLYRSRTDRKLAGVCGGLGAYFNIDPTLFRIIFLILFLGACQGLVLYIILWLIMPQEP